MRLLHRKLRRDLWHLRGPFLAVVLVVAAGVSLFVALRSMHGHLRAAQTAYYRAYHFADLFVPVVRAPQSVAREIAALPGVAQVETRVVADVLLDVPGLPEPATGRFISLPDTEEREPSSAGEAPRPRLNDLHLRSGRMPGRGEAGAVLASDAFARANDLRPGDRLGAVLHGRFERLTIVGTAIAPEFVYEIRGSGDIFPDNRRFGAFWMSERALAAAFDLENRWNEAVLTLAPDATPAAIAALVERLDERLAPYGALGAYGREDHVSHRFLSDEIAETRVTSLLLPSIFLGVTAFLLHLVMHRLVATQREQIAVLKAFGYRSSEVTRHYFALAAVPVGAGAVVGVGTGLAFAGSLARLYARFFQFPPAEATFRPDPGVVAAGLAVSALAALAGAFVSVVAAARMPPAEAMRPDHPETFRRSPFDRGWIRRRLSLPSRSIARHLFRRPGRAALSILGLALAGSILVASRFVYDAVEWIRRVQFEHVQRESIAVTFTNPRPHSALDELRRLPGVLSVEPVRVAPIRLRSGAAASGRPGTERTAIFGLTPAGELRRIVDRHFVARRPPPSGLVLSSRLAERLGARAGDLIELSFLDGRRRRVSVRVEGVVEDLLGAVAYADLETLEALAGDGETISGAFLRADEAAAEALFSRLSRLPGVAGVSSRRATARGFEATIAESFRISLGITVFFAAVIAAGMVYNGARVALSERGRELASLRVLGFTRREVATMLLGEQATLTALSLPLALALGYALCALVVLRFESELFRIPLVVSGATVLFAVGTVTLAAVASGALVRRRLDRFDLVSVLKARE
jgi:putative ABC transport system permease protein